MHILNLTQHKATKEQVAGGLVEPSEETKRMVQELLTFTFPPSKQTILISAKLLTQIAKESGCEYALIGGASYLMAPLEKELRFARLIPVYSFTERASEEKLVDGKVIKTNSFVHIQWIEGTTI
jgi:hypothetical protein